MADAKEPEATEVKLEDITDRVSKLKKIGLPTGVVVLIMAMGFPGFWSLFDRSGTEAKVQAEVSYQLLKAHTEALTEQMVQYRHEMNDLRDVINSMLLQRSALGMAKMPEVVPAPRLAPLPATIEQADDTAAGRAAMVSAGVDPSTEL